MESQRPHKIRLRDSESLLKIEEAYLSARGCYLPVAASIKLFDKPFCYKEDDSTRIIVYTSFRDSKTYDKHSREIGEQQYTIDGNADFIHCLTKDDYIINNAKQDSGNYANEHIDFERYYNCSIVAPIRIKLQEGKFRFLGYLCCDCLNHDDGKEIFDHPSAQYLFAVAQQYATFLDTLDANWYDRIKENTALPKSILQLIYDKTYTGKRKTK